MNTVVQHNYYATCIPYYSNIYQYRRDQLFYSDVIERSINVASLIASDSEVTVLLNDSFEVIGMTISDK